MSRTQIRYHDGGDEQEIPLVGIVKRGQVVTLSTEIAAGLCIQGREWFEVDANGQDLPQREPDAATIPVLS